MDYFVVDIEANGLDVNTVDIHCIVIQRPGLEPEAYRPEQTEEAILRLNSLLAEGYVLAGHNVVRYDLPILRRYGMDAPEADRVYDTLVVSRAAYPGSRLGALDKEFLRRNPVMREDLMVGAHSLKAWGLRLGNHKEDYDGGFEQFNEAMLHYCIQDVAVNVDLVEKLRDRIADSAAFLDCEVARVAARMSDVGFAFDVGKAEGLVVELTARREELTTQLREAFQPWYAPAKPGEVTVPKRNMVSRKYAPGTEGYTNVAAGCGYTKVVLNEFNPASTKHIADRLMKVRGWDPVLFTDGGQPQVTAEVLRDLSFPEAPLLAEYQEIKKILGYLSEGTNAWLKLEKDGRIHGNMNPTGTVSSRCSHNRPNLGNVPTRSDLGHKCRELFKAGAGKVIIGADASGLQLRGLAHYLGRWDGGQYADQILNGDIHSFNQQAIGLHTRDAAKTFVYALLFGAGEAKLGQTVIADEHTATGSGPPDSKARALGKAARRRLGQSIPAFDELTEGLKAAAASGKLRALDGRDIPVASDHVALAMLLQSAEACIMKKALTLAAPRIYALGGEVVAMVHDEIQAEGPPENAEAIGQVLVDSMREAGEFFDQRIPIDGEYAVGPNWASTH
jgi:DNA polymerase-1